MMRSKWATVALVLSLLLNLLLVGFLLGQRTHQHLGGDPTRGFPRWAHTLPEPRQETLRPLIRDHMRMLRPSLRDMRRQHATLAAAIGAEPFDAERLKEALASMRGANQQVQKASHAAFVAFVAELTPDERRILLEDIRRPGRPPWRRPPGPQ